MSAQQADAVCGFLAADVDVSTQRRIVRRAGQLCLRAEPHTDQSPCLPHVNEAKRQLLGCRAGRPPTGLEFTGS